MTEEEITKFLVDNHKEMKNTELIARCGLKRYQFYRKMKVLGLVKKPQKSWTTEEKDLLRSMWDKHSKSDILKAFPDRNYRSLKSVAHTLGCVKDKDLKYHNKLKNLVNESNESYYWLGLLMADGHFSKTYEIKLSLSAKDICIFEKFMKYIDYDANIKFSYGHTYGSYNSQNYNSISIRDINTVKILIEKYSIVSNKTKSPCDISSIQDKEKFISWFVGFFDGDGCMMKDSKGKLSGMRIQIHHSWIDNLDLISKKLLNDFDIKSRSYIDTQGYARWVCFGRENHMKFVDYVESLSLPYLDRKWGFAKQSVLVKNL
jgi:hypothetical protein